MRVTWVKQSEVRRVEWLGDPRVPSTRKWLGAGGVTLATSGIIAPLAVLGVLGLAVYGAAQALSRRR